jgi:Protein of unknown function (DUF1566)
MMASGSLRCLAASAALLACGAVSAQSAIAFNDSGARTCVDTAGQGLATCQGSGQDGAHGRDKWAGGDGDGFAGFSFVKVCNNGALAGSGNACKKSAGLGPAANQWACTYDKVTGLIWETKLADGSARDGATLFHLVSKPGGSRYGTRVDYVNDINAMALCGYTDWRLPTYIEATTALNLGASGGTPLVDSGYFPNISNTGSRYWTSSSFAPDGTRLLSISYGDYGDSEGPGIALGHVMLVRGQTTSSAAHTPRRNRETVDQYVYDEFLQLTWHRCYEGQAAIAEFPYCAGEMLRMGWYDALSYAKAKGNGWRLPTVKEWMSLQSDGNRSGVRWGWEGLAWANETGWTSTPTGVGSATAYTISVGGVSYGPYRSSLAMDQTLPFVLVRRSE